MKVRVNSKYVYHANFLDRVDTRTDLKDGELVRVVNVYGCPKANVMGHAYVVRVSEENDPAARVGLVHTNSLHTKADYIEYLKSEMARISINVVKLETKGGN